MPKRRKEKAGTSQESELFKRLQESVAEWTSQDADTYRGLTDQLAKVRQALDALVQGASRQRDNAAEMAQRMRADTQALQDALAAKASSSEEADYRVEQLEKTLAKRRDVSAEDQQRIAQVERDLAERGEEVLSVKEATRKLEQELEKEREAAQTAQKQVTQLERQLAERADASEAAQSRVAKLEREVTKAREAADAASQRVAELEQAESSLEDRASDLAKALKAAEEARKRIEELEQTERDLRAQLDELAQAKGAADAAQKRVAELERSEHELKARLEEAQAQLDKAHTDEQSAVLDLEVTLADLVKAREELEPLKESEKKVDELRKLLQAERQRAERLERELREEATKRTKSVLAQQLAEALRESEAAQEEAVALRAQVAKLRGTAANGASRAAEEPPTERIRIPEGRDAQKRDLGALLVEAGVVTREQLEEALEEQRKSSDHDLGAILVDKGLATEDAVAQARACQAGVPFVRLEDEAPDPEAARLLSDRLAKLHTCVPLRTEGNKLILAMANALDLVAIEDIERTTNLTVAPVLATPSDITGAIERLYAGE